MRSQIQRHLDQVLGHLYINPLEKCNLRCKICYTRKTSPILKKEEILDFVSRYRKTHGLETVTFCGGEVFTLPYFPELVNTITASQPRNRIVQNLHHYQVSDSSATKYKLEEKYGNPSIELRSSKLVSSVVSENRHNGIFVQIITNGTIDRLSDFDNPNMVNLIVSLDGLKNYHDKNRGRGNFAKSIAFLEKANRLGFHTEIFSIVTRQNLGQIDEFESYLKRFLRFSVSVTYHPRKPPAYLLHHPISNVFGETDGFDFLRDEDMIEIMKKKRTFPPKDLGCYQIALVSDGRVFGCCEGTVSIGRISDEIDLLFNRLKDRIEVWEKANPPVGGLKNCLGCSQPDFVCGIKKYLKVILGNEATPESNGL
ncbi:radical SAM protein [Patescibacteria group bacterium]|nr:radical SAM protein [Patescibacteria group bacterium]